MGSEFRLSGAHSCRLYLGGCPARNARNLPVRSGEPDVLVGDSDKRVTEVSWRRGVWRLRAESRGETLRRSRTTIKFTLLGTSDWHVIVVQLITRHDCNFACWCMAWDRNLALPNSIAHATLTCRRDRRMRVLVTAIEGTLGPYLPRCSSRPAIKWSAMTAVITGDALSSRWRNRRGSNERERHARQRYSAALRVLLAEAR